MDVVVDIEPHMPRAVEVFTQAQCVWCARARTWLGENHVPYDDLDIGNPKNHRALLALVGGKNVGTPVLHWDDAVLVGYTKAGMEHLLYPDGRTSSRDAPARSPIRGAMTAPLTPSTMAMASPCESLVK